MQIEEESAKLSIQHVSKTDKNVIPGGPLSVLFCISLSFFFPKLHQKKIYFGSSIHFVFNLFCQFQYSFFFLITTDGVCITQHKVWHVETIQQSSVPFSAEA